MSNPVKPVVLTGATFQQEVLESPIPVLVDFWAAWCGPCRMVNPIVDALATEFTGRVKVGKLNIDEYTAIASHYSIQAIPTLLIFQHGQVVEQIVGVASQRTIASKLDALLPVNTTTRVAHLSPQH